MGLSRVGSNPTDVVILFRKKYSQKNTFLEKKYSQKNTFHRGKMPISSVWSERLPNKQEAVSSSLTLAT